DYFSASGVRGAGDILLVGARLVPTLAPSGSSSGTVSVVIPSTTPLGTYMLLACADDTKIVAEQNETNNCRASATAITVALPDLVEQSVSNPRGTIRSGATIVVSDTAVNTSGVATPPPKATHYLLSAHPQRRAGDPLLAGARIVPILAASAASSGSVTVAIPTTTVPGTYVLLACADDTRLVAEQNETNNCRASSTPVVVIP